MHCNIDRNHCQKMPAKKIQQRLTIAVFYHIPAFFMVLFFLITPTPSFGTPDNEEIREDIRKFQKFFQNRFPTVKLETYQDGVNGLPQYSHRIKNWKLLSSVPIHIREIRGMEKDWEQSFVDGSSLATCFSDKPPGNQYPYFNGTSIRTIVGDINDCLSIHSEQALNANRAKMAKLVAFYKSKANGQPVSIDYSSPMIRDAYQKGRQYYWTRRGQRNFSCASCHVQNSGNQIRSDVISAALGQSTGFPVYRTAWALQGQPWGTIHRRYASCHMQAGAVPPLPQSAEYIALQVYQGIMNTGIPLKVPGRRQ